MGRYSGTLANLVEEAINASKSKQASASIWSKVLTYLQNHSTTDGAIERPEFDSPLPPFSVPSESLDEQLLERKFGPRQDNTILKLAVSAAPAPIVAALCHLQPHAARIPDHRGKLPLHVACRRSPNDKDTQIVFDVLLAVFEEGLAHRDSAGRTPLHCLFMYNHAQHRSVSLVETFCKTLPPNLFDYSQPETNKDDDDPLPEVPLLSSDHSKVPSNAAIVPDCRHGALPLHYAVMEGASRDVIRLLLHKYPESKRLVDRKGRTALSWYLGAGCLAMPRSVTGEPQDSASFWDKNKVESATVQLLLNSSSARLADSSGRGPLHWAIATCARHIYTGHGPSVSMKTIQLLLDHHIEALITGDWKQQTPLHILFEAVAEVQQAQWNRLQRNKTERTQLDLIHGGPTAFSPPKELLEVLVNTPESTLEDRSAVFMEDAQGRLPIHTAVSVASSPECIKYLIQANPTSLVHTTEEKLLSPLHMAVLCPYTAPLQTPATMRLVLRAYVASRHGTYVDGRLALKMEDADGNYPIHYACRNQVCLEVLRMLVEEYPKCALFPTADGDLPLHQLLDAKVFETDSNGVPPLGASLARSNTWFSDEEKQFHQQRLKATQQKIQLLLEPIMQSEKVEQWLKTPSFAHGLLPLHMAAAWGCASYTTVKRMLDNCPNIAETLTTVEGHKYSPLQLHEYFKSRVCLDPDEEVGEEWQHVRELLFAYSPLVPGHAQLDDILLQSAQVVRVEVNPNNKAKTIHYQTQMTIQNQPDLPTIEASDTFASIEIPNIDHGGRPLSKKSIQRSRLVSPKTKKTSSSSSSRKKRLDKFSNAKTPKKSIYDDDAMDIGYVVSSDGEQKDCEDDEDYFSGPESVEEYLSDASDDRFASFDDNERKNSKLRLEEKNVSRKQCQPKEGEVEKASNETDEEEKKEDELRSHEQQLGIGVTGPMLSEVGMRLLTFFILYCDPRNPSDNYASYVENILDEVSRVVVEQVITLPLPPYAAQYLENGIQMKGLTLRDAASPKCRELLHRLFYFLGRFDFRSETGGILLQKASDGTRVQVRSTEWTFSTEEYNEAPEMEPGLAEAQIWETGIIPPEEVGYMGTTFRAMRRSICFLFTKNAQAYLNEVKCREELGVSVENGSFSESHIVPLIAHFNATSLERREDRVYKNDTNNESFVTLDIFGKYGSAGETICLTDYPYALVYPYSNYGDLFDYFFRHGVDGMEEIQEICSQVGKAISCMHDKGIVHGSISLRNIVLFPPVADAEIEDGRRKHWALANLAGACRLSDDTSLMGKISSQGLAGFNSASLPPEMFVKLSPDELQQYNDYWNTVERIYGLAVDRSVVDPIVDFHTGASYVMRCHFVSDEDDDDMRKGKLPPLPYKLLPARESSDIWALGQLLFMLCSSGRPLFPTNARSGHLLNYKEICEWDVNTAEGMVYKHIDSPLAQDILLRLLGTYETRSSITMESVLSHPFFSDSALSSSVAKTIMDKRSKASAAYKRWLENNVTEKSEEGWLSERTVNVACWDFDFQTRIHLTPTALIPSMLSGNVGHLGMPCSFVILPYKLVRNKKGVLTPPAKRDVERAELLGLRMLALSKACHFVNVMKKAVSKSSVHPWSSSTLLDAMQLSKEEFGDLQTAMAQLAAEHVEQFRSDPAAVGRRLIQGKIKEFLACYDESSKVLFYLVDEYTGVPVISSSSAPFPHQVSSNMKLDVAKRGLPFMYLSARYFSAISGSASGLVKLIFEAASPFIPPSWKPVCAGLDNPLDREAILEDMKMLCSSLSDLESNKTNATIGDDFDFMQKYLAQVDPRRTYANLTRVLSGEASVWTGKDGVEEIKEAAKHFGFQQAIENKQKTDQKLLEQENRIRELEVELEKLKFRSHLSLQVPEEEGCATKVASPNSTKDDIPEPAAASDPYELGKKCIEANTDLMTEKSASDEELQAATSWNTQNENACEGTEIREVPSEPEPDVSEEMSVDRLYPVEGRNSHDENQQPEVEEMARKIESKKHNGLDNIFAEAELAFESGPLSPKKKSGSTPMWNERSRGTVSPRRQTADGSPQSKESRCDMNDGSTISSEHDDGAVIEITHEELQTLKSALMKSNSDAGKKETLSEMFEKEIAGLGDGGKSSARSSRPQSDVSAGSVESGSVRRLANMYLSKQRSPVGSPGLSSPSAGIRRSAAEASNGED